jgi:hypothetical protein
MLRIESVLNGGEEGDVGEHLREAKEILVALIKQVTPDRELTGFTIGSQEIAVVFAALLHGESVAEAVLEAISGHTGDEPDAGEPAILTRYNRTTTTGSQPRREPASTL